MSLFLIYFEKNNPNTSWKEFQRKQESIIETFTKVNEKSLLRIEGVKVLIDGKMIDSLIIHDGVSSDRILQANLKSDPIISKQRIVVLDFLESRLSMNAFDHYFIFHLYHGSIDEIEEVDYDHVVEARLSDLKDFSGAVRKDLLYKLLG
jgi:hypothetical protein